MSRKKTQPEIVSDNTSKTVAMLKRVLATPTVSSSLSNEQKIDAIEKHFRGIMETLGLDLSNDSLRNTPKRVAKMYVNEVFSGLDSRNFPKMTTIKNHLAYDQMVLVRNITTLSTCEHHFVTIDGLATIAYIPKKKVIGLSKINRIVQFFSKRPQVQERLTKQIADCLQEVLGTKDVAVWIDAKHYCVVQRGVEDPLSTTVTCDLRGSFKTDSKTRTEFMSACSLRNKNHP